MRDEVCRAGRDLDGDRRRHGRGLGCWGGSRSGCPGELIMLGLTAETRVFVKRGATDLRLAFEGLRTLVVNWW